MRAIRRPRSIRLRLAAFLTLVFVLLGGTLLGVSYALVRSNLSVDPHELADTAAARLGIELRPNADGEIGPEALHDAIRREAGGADRVPDRVLDTGVHERRVILEEIREVQEDLADDALRELTLQYLAILAAMTLLSGVLGWLVSGRLLRPVTEITETARRVSKESLHERIALEGPEDELKQLADTFDSMLERLEEAFERQDAFVRNASHELRTPLSVIRTEADVSLADEADNPEALRRSLAVVREAGERSERLVTALLTLAQADRDRHPRVEVDLRPLVSELAATHRHEGLRLDLDLDEASLTGDPELLRTMVANLIDNAARYNAPAGWIAIRTGRAGARAWLEISNAGSKMSATEAASLAEPFRRLGDARTGDGLGLGLSIAAAVAQSHGGELAIQPLEDGGVRVSVELARDPIGSPSDRFRA